MGDINVNTLKDLDKAEKVSRKLITTINTITVLCLYIKRKKKKMLKLFKTMDNKT